MLLENKSIMQIAGERLKLAIDLGEEYNRFTDLVTDPRWLAIVKVKNDKTIRSWVKGINLTLAKVKRIAQYFRIPEEYFIDPGISNTQFIKKILNVNMLGGAISQQRPQPQFDQAEYSIVFDAYFLKDIANLVINVQRGKNVRDELQNFIVKILPSRRSISEFDSIIKTMKNAKFYRRSQKEKTIIHNVLANIYIENEMYDQAIPLLEDIISSNKKMYGENHPETLEVYSDLGRLFWQMGQYLQSQKVYKKLYAIRLTYWGARHIDTREALNNLGVSAHFAGNSEEACKLFEELKDQLITSLQQQEDTKGIMELLMQVLNNHAWVLKEMTKFKEALTIYEEILRLYSEKFGKDHVDTLTVKANLAQVLAYLQETDKAEFLYDEVLKKRIKWLGENHTYTINTKHDLAMMRYSKGKHKEAKKMIEETLPRVTKILGPENPERLKHLNNLGIIQLSLGEVEEAKGLFKEAIRYRVKSLSLKHLETLSSFYNLGRCYQKNGQIHKSIKLLQFVCLTFDRYAYPTSHPYYKEVKAELYRLENPEPVIED